MPQYSLPMSTQNTTFPPYVQSEYHQLCCLCPVSTPSLRPMSSQYITSTAYVQSVQSLPCPCSVSAPHFQPMYIVSSVQVTISHARTHPKYDFSCHSPARIPPLLPMSSEHTISPVHVQSEYQNLSCTCQVSTSPLLPMLQYFLSMSTTQNTTSLANTQPE